MKKRDKLSIGLIALGLISMAYIAPLYGQNVSSSTMTSMCAIAKNPKAFDGQSVTVKARVIADWEYGATIYDESCGDLGLHLFVNDDAKGKGALDTVLNWCHRGTRGKFIEGTFTGIVQLKNGTPFERRITVQRVESLAAKSTHTGSASFPTPCPDPPPLDLR